MNFNAHDHVIVMERKAKKKDAQGRDTWEVTKTEYLPVQWRIVWFREENPKGKIDSKALTIDLAQGAAIFETYVEKEDGGSARMHGSETQGDWKDYIEKAQTKSLGRALAAVGYGSQFTDDEFDEGERIVDSPVERQNGHQDGKLSNHPSRTGKTPSAPPQREEVEVASPAPDAVPTPGQLRASFKALQLDKKGTFEQFVKAKLGQPLNDEALNQTHCRALSKRLDEVEKATTGAGGGH